MEKTKGRLEKLGASLVVGGTGMLAGATRWLAARSETTLLVARHASRFAPGDRRVVPLDADWTAAGFQADLEGALRVAPPIGQALLWLHEPEPILPWLLPLLPKARVVLVLGSLDGRPEIPGAAARVVTVRLGSKSTAGGGRRWLTDEEISEGAIRALESGEAQIVGDLSAL